VSAPRTSLVLGANGLVGSRLGAALTGRSLPWLGTCWPGPVEGLRPLDITDAGAVASWLEEIRPGVVYHAANLAGGVDFCESHPRQAAAFHLEATSRLGDLCARLGATLVFISTDYVFDGTSGPYREDDPKNPLNHYGRLKLAAEEWLGQHLERRVIARTTNVFGWDAATKTPNFVMGMYRALSEGRGMKVPSFLWGNPTAVGDLAEALVELATREAFGVYHLVGSSFLNRLEWARRACAVLELDATLLTEVAEPPAGMVPRPLRSWLATDRFRNAFTTPLHDVEFGLACMRRDMLADPSPR
jgi:dTDP-4-dehydrorhamnose reductase